MKRMWALGVIVVVLLCGAAAFFLLRYKVTEDMGDEVSVFEEDWLPYVVLEEKDISPLDGFLLLGEGSIGREETVSPGRSTEGPGGGGGAVTEGVPENYPEKLVPLYKDAEVDTGYTYEDDDGFVVQYYSEASYEELVKFYRNKLGDKPEYNEIEEYEGEMWIRCQALDYGVEMQICGSDGTSSVIINISYISD